MTLNRLYLNKNNICKVPNIGQIDSLIPTESFKSLKKLLWDNESRIKQYWYNSVEQNALECFRDGGGITFWKRLLSKQTRIKE